MWPDIRISYRTIKPTEKVNWSWIEFIFQNKTYIICSRPSLVTFKHHSNRSTTTTEHQTVYKQWRLVLSIHQAKEKRGWTLNSAGYLLGPRKYQVHTHGPAHRHTASLMSTNVTPEQTGRQNTDKLLCILSHCSGRKLLLNVDSVINLDWSSPITPRTSGRPRYVTKQKPCVWVHKIVTSFTASSNYILMIADTNLVTSFNKWIQFMPK